MKTFKQLSLTGLAWLCLGQIAVGQPCVNGISTNPNNPINNQFIPMAEAWYNLPPNDPAYVPYTDNPWLNQFNWYWPNSIKIYKQQVNWDHGWNENPAIADMMNPYDPGMPEGFEYLRPTGVATQNLDYRWEDGWELLYMNLGYYPDLNHTNDPAPGSYYANPEPPNGDPLHFDPRPSRAPYFVIYNRYRGLMRVVANVWYEAEATFNDIDVVLRFTSISEDENRLTGLLRHASAYDKALSEPTDIWEIHAPRFHAPDLTQWLVADFQVGYDPCSCMSSGELILDFNAFSTMDVEIIGRSISVDVPITELDYRTKDFLNLSAINTENYEPGTEIYRSMDALASQYRNKQLKYIEDLNTYNQWAPLRLALEIVGVNAVGEFIARGLTNITLTDSLYTWITTGLETETLSSLPPILGAQPPNPPIQIEVPMTELVGTEIERQFSDKAKKEIGRVFGNFSAEIFKGASPNKPIPPAIPAATLEESVYKGTIGVFAPLSSSPLILPGSLPQAWDPNTSLSPNRIPVYNEVLGKVALLSTPNPMAKRNLTVDITNYFSTWTIHKDIELRFHEELHFALNGALDFDLNQSTSYAMVEIEVKEGNLNITQLPPDTLYNQTNLFVATLPIEDGIGDLVLSRYSSKWYPMDQLLNMVFSLKNTVELNWLGVYPDLVPTFTPELISVKLKVMHDFYFDQIGTSQSQINTLDVFTYSLYQWDGANHFQDDGPWAAGAQGYFDAYIPGLITLGNETITTSHPLVHHVDANEIHIHGQEVQINGPLQVQQGFKLIVSALESIHTTPDASFNPHVHLRIKNDFYSTPVFEYADNATVYNFCNDNNAYQANTASRALRDRIERELAEQAEKEEQLAIEKAANPEITLRLFPNPTRQQLTGIYHNALSQNVHIEVYAVDGRRVHSQLLGHSGYLQFEIDLSGQGSGLYIVRVLDENGHSHTERVQKL